MKPILLVLSGLLILAQFGCEFADRVEGMRTVQAEFEPGGRKMLIIPFAVQTEGRVLFDYFESTDGIGLSDSAAFHIRQARVTHVIAYDAIPHGERIAYHQSMKETSDLSALELYSFRYDAWKKMAQNLDCKLMLVGEIHSLSTGNPLDVNLRRGDMTFSARLYDLSNDSIVWSVRNKHVVYPEGQEYEAGIHFRDMTAAQIQNRLLNRAGEIISQYFYTHRVPR